jgi:hypothetical protein
MEDFDVSSSSNSEDSQDTSVERKESIVIRGVGFKQVNENIAIPGVVDSAETFLQAKFFSVLLLRSGRFAGAVWDNHGNVLAHNCFKRYTVRRKNGGSQSRNDKSKGSPAHSAGAQIRRAQEQKLDEEVEDLIAVRWKHFFQDPQCVVFSHASKSLADTLMRGPLERTSRKCRVFSIPLSLRDPTFAEVCRVYDCLVCFALKDN